jgi:RsiW-degrading membrane proteinase PrsW (M82 family)
MLSHILTLIPVALIPCLVLLVLVYRLDRYAPEKPVWILVALALGAVSFFPSMAIGALVGRGALADNTLAMSIVRNMLIVAPLEEILKFSVLLGFASYRKFFDEPLDCMIYAWTIALGFAACENVVYITQQSDAFLWRAVFSTPSHPLFAGLWGWALGNWRYSNRSTLGIGIIVAMMLQASLAHGIYNFTWDLGSMPPHVMPGNIQVPPGVIIGSVSVLLMLLVTVNGLYYRRHVQASPFRFSMLPKGVRTMRRDMVGYTWRRWVHALWLVVLGLTDVGIIALALVLASVLYTIQATGDGIEALGVLCTVTAPSAMLTAGVLVLAIMAVGFLLSGIVYGKFSRARSSALVLLTPGIAAVLALMLIVGLAPKWLGMWLTGLSGQELAPPCGLTFRKFAQSFMLYSSYIIIGIGFVGGWMGRAWRKSAKKKRSRLERGTFDRSSLQSVSGSSLTGDPGDDQS